MSSLEQRIQAFVKLGEFLRGFDLENHGPGAETPERLEFRDAVERATLRNGWFTAENLKYALSTWGHELTEENLRNWVTPYSITDADPKVVAIIMAGNIPLVGFHDLLSVLITGNRALVKMSTSDSQVTPALLHLLFKYEPSLKDSVSLTDGILKGFDAVIATGSDNTSRYFEYYFGNKPHIIRKNRNSVAVLTGMESQDQLCALGEDVFRYFGLGCRNVSKLFVPEGYSFEVFFEAIKPFEYLKNNHKYHNNYDYNKAVYLMSEFKFLDNGFLILKEDGQYASPIGVVYFETYSSKKELIKKITADQDKIQCLVAEGFSEGEVAFGHSQKPSLSDYADGVDTVEFLLKT